MSNNNKTRRQVQFNEATNIQKFKMINTSSNRETKNNKTRRKKATRDQQIKMWVNQLIN